MEAEASKLILDDVEDFGTGRFVPYQKYLWDLMEKPDTSMAAKAMSSISMLFVVISTFGMVLNTMHAFQHTDLAGKPIDNPELALVESVCISWFTLEYLLRFAGSPGKLEFLIDGMNIVDVLGEQRIKKYLLIFTSVFISHYAVLRLAVPAERQHHHSHPRARQPAEPRPGGGG